MNRYEFKREYLNFKLDMKIMYSLVGKRAIKEMLKISYVFPLMFFFFYLADVPINGVYYVFLIFSLGMLTGYFIMYFSIYRAMYRKERKEQELIARYSALICKFSKSSYL